MYKLSRRSQDNLEGVDKRLQTVVRTAIALTKIDLVGKAVDLMAYINGRASWEMNLYDDIADAMKEAANISSVQICWGAAWATPDMPYPMNIRKWKGTMEEAMNAYIDLRRSQGRRPFMDGPHFELID